MAVAVADFVVVATPTERLLRTPEGISDEVASTLPVAGRTAAAALAAIGLRPGDRVLVGARPVGSGCSLCSWRDSPARR